MKKMIWSNVAAWFIWDLEEDDFNSSDLQGCFKWTVFLASDRGTEVSDLIHNIEFIPLTLYFLIIDSSSSLCCSFLNLLYWHSNCAPRNQHTLEYVILIVITLLWSVHRLILSWLKMKTFAFEFRQKRFWTIVHQEFNHSMVFSDYSGWTVLFLCGSSWFSWPLEWDKISFFIPKNLRKIGAYFGSVMRLCLQIQGSLADHSTWNVLPMLRSTILNIWIGPCILGEWWNVIAFESQWYSEIMSDHSDHI
jgi:hypothetical protein